MGQQIIEQPDGRLAVWSTIVDDWVLFDASREEVVEHFAEQAAEDARRLAARNVDAVLAGQARRAYYQFAMTFEEAQRRRHRAHGSAAWPPVEDERMVHDL